MPGQRRIDILDATADARLNNEPHETDFVAYLRLAFRSSPSSPRGCCRS